MQNNWKPPLTPDLYSTVYGRIRMGPPDCSTWEDCDVIDGACQYEGCSWRQPEQLPPPRRAS